MAILDADFATDLSPVEAVGEIGSTPAIRPEQEPRDWQSLYEQAHALAERERDRADAAEARCEELRWAEVDSRARANSFKTHLGKSRAKLKAAIEETKELRRSVKEMPSLQAEVVCLRKYVWRATGPSDDVKVVSLRNEVARLRKLLGELETPQDTARPHSGGACQAHTPPAEARQLKATIRSLRTENRRLGKEVVRWSQAVGESQKKVDSEKERAESIRRSAKMLSRENLNLHRELRYLEKVETRARSLSDEAYRLRHALKLSQGREEKLKARLAELRAAGATLSKLPFDEAAQLRTVLKRSRRQKTMINRLSRENTRLRKAVKVARTGRQAAEARVAGLRSARKTLSMSMSGMDTELRRTLRRSRRQKATIKSLFRENARLRKAVKAAKAGRQSAEARVAGLRSARRTLSMSLSGMDAELRRSLRRSRRQKAAIKSLSRKNVRLRRAMKGSRGRIETLEAQLAKLRSSSSVMSKRLYGRRSEQQKKPDSGRQRGQQRGAPGHGRTQRPGLEERPETLDPAPEACACACCGQPYAPNGAEESTLVEIEVKAYKRVINRPRFRRTCECASSPMEVSAPPVPRLFANTLFGISVWTCFLFERYACFRTLNGVAAWMSERGLAISPGTLANSRKRFVPLFETLYEAILAHQNTATLRHADETSWRVQELRGEDRSSRAWLWTSVSSDAVYFHIDPSRSAEAALKLFAEARPGTIIVCDRYSAYKRLARLLGDKAILAYCWSHQRRDFIEAAAGQERLTQWCQEWIERIAEIFRLNEARLEHYDPGRKRQTAAFRKATRELKKALDGLFAHAGTELVALPAHAREGKALRSLLNHREGLCVFVDHPQVPLTNNLAERILRAPAIGRGLSFGSDSEKGAEFTAMMYSVIGTLSMNGIDVLRWLEAWLKACAENGRQPPEDLEPWLPWSMSEKRKREFMAPG